MTKAQLRRSPPLALRVVGLYVLVAFIAGVSVLYQSAVNQRETVANARLTVEQVKPTLPSDKPVKSGSPSQLIVKRLGINLPIKNGYYDYRTGEWTLSDTDAFYATMTDKPNDNRGSTFIYGHNRPTAFEPLKDIRDGDTVTIKTTNGFIFTYSYARDTIVKPNVTNVLSERPNAPQLVLMTCEGVWSEVRRIMYFNFEGVSRA